MSLGEGQAVLRECFREKALLKDDKEFVRWPRRKVFQEKRQVSRHKVLSLLKIASASE